MRAMALLAVAAVVGAGCSWGQSGFDGGHGGWNRLDTAVTPSTVQQLGESWRFALASGDGIQGPVMDATHAFVTVQHSGTARLLAFDLDGSDTCTGAPRICAPTWSAVAPFGVFGPPIVIGTKVFLAGGDGSGTWRILGFDATGSAGCGGSPRTCGPVWSAQWTGPGSGNGVALMGDGSRLVAQTAPIAAPNQSHTTSVFDVTADCSAAAPACSPAFTMTTPGQGLSAIAGDVIYLGTPTGVTAFDANGTSACGGSPKTCQPLRSFSTPAAPSFVSVVGATLYVGNVDDHFGGPYTGKTYGFDATGRTGCSGTPPTCLPRVVASSGSTPNPVVTDGTLYVLTGDPWASGGFGGGFAAIDLGGRGCTGTIAFCSPVRTAFVPGGLMYQAASHSVLYATGNGDAMSADGGRLYAYGAGGEGCQGDPATCDPLLTLPIPPYATGLAAGSGRVVVAAPQTPGSTGGLFVYSLPA